MAYVSLATLKQYLGIKDYDTFTSGAVSTSSDTITLTAISFVDLLATGDEVELSSSESTEDLPEPLDDDTIYYAIRGTDQAIQLATSSANATAGTAINLTDGGTGTHTITLGDNDDTLLTACITRAQRGVETYTRRVFEAAADTRYYGAEDVDGQWLWLDADLYALTSVANGDSSGTAVSTSDLVLFPRNQGPPYHKLYLKESSTSVWEVDTDYWIGVTATWGYSTSAPNDVVLATLRWAAYLYQQKDAPYTQTIANLAVGTVTLPADVPVDVKALLDPYVRHTI